MREWIALNMTPGIGPRAAAKLLERFGSAEAVFGAARAELESLRLRPEAVESIRAREFFEKAEEEVERARSIGVEILLLDDGVYPALLREIFDPPITLYVKGAWGECLEGPCVAIVGSRRSSTYGQNAAVMLARDLAQRGVTIISGLARGIDAAAHRGALEAGGRTVAVLGTPPTPQNFPYRNRVISGLSLGVVLVEAAENSGSLITARLALEQGREVFAVPGNITSRNSFGTNYLIKAAGAKLVQTWQDIAMELPPDIAARLLPPPVKDPAEEAAHIDALAEASQLPIPELTGALLALEMRDLIRQLPGKCFVRKL